MNFFLFIYWGIIIKLHFFFFHFFLKDAFGEKFKNETEESMNKRFDLEINILKELQSDLQSLGKNHKLKKDFFNFNPSSHLYFFLYLYLI